jgi:hypothetical protein
VTEPHPRRQTLRHRCGRPAVPARRRSHDRRTNRASGFVLAGLLVVLAQSVSTGQVRDRASRDAALGTASISGRVVTGSPPTPLSDADLTVYGQVGRVPASARTDADGRYTIRDLPAGLYTVTARRGGYLQLQYGQLRSFEPGTPLQLDAGDTLTGVDFQLPRGAVLTGTVFDQHGQPAVGVRVAVQRYQFVSGRWDMVGIGRDDSTDDRGVYRLFGLPPGDYYVEASPRLTTSDPTRSGSTYYPNSADLGSAQRVSLRAAQERLGIDVSLAFSNTARVSGRVVDARGLPLASARSVSLVARSPSGRRNRSAPIQPDGSFVIEGVPPGEFTLYANTPATEGPVQFAMADLLMSGSDREQVVLRTTTGATATGTIAVAGGIDVPFLPDDLQLFTMPMGFAGVPAGRGIGQVKQDWSFEIHGMGDAQLIRLLGLPDGWELDAVLLNGQDITDQPVHLPAGRATGEFRVVVTDNATRLHATIVDDAGRPVTDCRVVIFAADETRWAYPSRFVRAVRPDQHGTIDVRGLPTEHYLAFAAPGIERGSETNPEFLDRISRTAASFTLGAGETRELTIAVSEPQ